MIDLLLGFLAGILCVIFNKAYYQAKVNELNKELEESRADLKVQQAIIQSLREGLREEFNKIRTVNSGK